MTKQTVSTGTTANDGTGDSLRSAATKINANFTELYDKFGSGLALTDLIDFDSSSINFFNGAKTFKTNLGVVEPTQNSEALIPNYVNSLGGGPSYVVLDSASQTLRNKTLESASLKTPAIRDTSNTHAYTITPGELTADRIIRLPVATDSDSFVFANVSQTISNKILDSDQLINPRLQDFILNNDGEPMLFLDDQTGTVINYLTIGNSVVGNPIDLIPGGTDTNINLRLRGKGSGATLLAKRVAFQAGAAVTVGGGYFDSDEPILIMNDTSPTGDVAKNLYDGSVVGEVRYIINRMAANTLTVTPDNFAQGTDFALTSQETAHILWDGSNWFVVNKSDVTIT